MYSRLTHCTPAMNFDLPILQGGFTETGVFNAASKSADNWAISSFFVLATLTPRYQNCDRS
jgi:hypothetical protein